MTFAIWLVPPTVVECVSHSFERRKTRSAVAGSALYRNFSFQIASLYLLAVGGVIWYSVRDILASPLCAGQILGATVPKVAVYFMVFVIARIGITLPMLLLRLYGLWQGVRQLTGASPEQQEEEPCWWSYEGTNIAIVLVLANMYSVIAPWIMPLCAVYFAVASAVYRWLFKNVYAPEFDGAGQCWIGLFNTAMVGLFAGSLTLCGIVALDGVLTVQFFATWLLPVLIGLFQVRYNDVYGRLAEVMPLELAIEVDRNEGPLVVEKFDPNLYKDPMLLAFDPEETSMSTSSGSSSDDDES
ncbi:unnamed protein product [Prorocentrum cordatum]|uniref:CSC1/OSCA1-like 7TM region domain-containing protein n=1 Tax=Prorocentrum cordatum TaxID=2364126 RepID=A0ABN9QUZ4_9DINO|nr:unnamed protein product [Polarella glacialis]